MNRLSYVAILGLCAAVITSSEIANACSSCGCSFNSEWASEGYTHSSGLRLDARFAYIDQDQLRYGTNRVIKSSVPQDQEVQQRTITKETLLGLDYSPSREWGVRINVPFIDRTHSTLTPHEGEDEQIDNVLQKIHGGIAHGEQEISRSATSGIGDISIVSRYQGFTPLGNLGVQFGVKLPTGTFTDTFDSGHEAGNRIDRGLQNGTGTTDLIFGIYKFGVLAPRLEYFVQALGAQPIQEREEYRTGTTVTTTTGLGYRWNSWFKPQVQINWKYEAREAGSNSDRENSGRNLIAVTPGVNFDLSEELVLYSLLQIPVYQQGNGYQLAPQVIGSVGVRYSF